MSRGRNLVVTSKSMWHIKPILLAAGSFILIYALLILPWPGWNDFYSGYFRSVGQMAFTREDDQRIILFRPHHVQHGFSTLDTDMIVSNRALVSNSGQGEAEIVNLDSRSIGWTPTALTIALILATPVSLKQRAWALLWGMVSIHVFILFTLQVAIWNQSPAVSLIDFSPFWKTMVDALNNTLITQLGASFSVPVVIWILVTIRRENLFDISPPHPDRLIKSNPRSRPS
jgi:hypothetical protein